MNNTFSHAADRSGSRVDEFASALLLQIVSTRFLRKIVKIWLFSCRILSRGESRFMKSSNGVINPSNFTLE